MSHHLLTKEAIRDVLRRVIDPELDINVVDLGLIYDIIVSETGIVIRMTLTTPGCPLMSQLVNEVTIAIQRCAPNVDTKVELVWDPPWHPRMMSDSAKHKLGWREEMPPISADKKFCDITNPHTET